MTITKEEATRIFKLLETGHVTEFFNHVDDNVNWTVMGTHPLAGQYLSKAAFVPATFGRLNKILKEGVKLHLDRLFVDGNIVIAEMRALTTLHNGKPFNNFYCWVTRFDENKKIVEVRAYLDSALVEQALRENEK